jgi:hypothetical protein
MVATGCTAALCLGGPLSTTIEGGPMRGYLRILFVLACLALPLVPAAPAAANSYPGLVEKEWYHGNDILNARIAIEVNSAKEGRFRLRLRCFRTDANGRRSLQRCDFDHTALTCWFHELQAGVCETQADKKNVAEYVWVGSYRRLIAGHWYMADAQGFRARFRSSGYQGQTHRICTGIWTAFQSTSSPPIC